MNDTTEPSQGSNYHAPDDASLQSKEEERQRLAAEVEAFLARGGTIDEIPPNVLADPPKKPESNYGGQPI